MNEKELKKIWYWANSKDININCLGESISECNGDNINSHALQRNGVLSKLIIDKREKLYTLTSDDNGYKYKEVHPKTASTFPGFCNEHDTRIFIDIERGEYKGTKKEHFLHAYRCNSLSYYQKLNSEYKNNLFIKELKKNVAENPVLQFELNRQLSFFNISAEDIKLTQNLLTKSLKAEEWNSISTEVFNIDSTFNFSASFRGALGDINHKAFSHDKESVKSEILNTLKFQNGRITAPQLINKINDIPMVQFFINVIPDGEKTKILVSYEKKTRKESQINHIFLKIIKR